MDPQQSLDSSFSVWRHALEGTQDAPLLQGLGPRGPAGAVRLIVGTVPRFWLYEFPSIAAIIFI